MYTLLESLHRPAPAPCIAVSLYRFLVMAFLSSERHNALTACVTTVPLLQIINVDRCSDLPLKCLKYSLLHAVFISKANIQHIVGDIEQ